MDNTLPGQQGSRPSTDDQVSRRTSLKGHPIIALLKKMFESDFMSMVSTLKRREQRAKHASKLTASRHLLLDEHHLTERDYRKLNEVVAQHEAELRRFLIRRFQHNQYQGLPALRWKILDLRSNLKDIGSILNLRSDKKAFLYHYALGWVSRAIVQFLSTRTHNVDGLLEVLIDLRPEDVPLYDMNPQYFYGACANADPRYGYVIGRLIKLLEELGLLEALTDSDAKSRADMIRGVEAFVLYQTLGVKDLNLFAKLVDNKLMQLRKRWKLEIQAAAEKETAWTIPWTDTKKAFVSHLIGRFQAK